MVYKQQRDYENLNRAMFRGVGEYGVPAIAGDDPMADNWISFNYAKGCEEPEMHGVHFFIDDYQFVRVWKNPDKYIRMLSRFQAVCSPDFSTYTDFPKAVQVYNHYCKHWLGAYWQINGIRVVPTISWAGPDSYEWCFDGEPVGYTVAVSTIGTQADEESRKAFMDGYEEMMRRLRPKTVIMYGKVPEGCPGNIVPVRAFQQKWRK